MVDPCQDIDLFFILFVFAAKPMYKSAQTWFDKFEIGDKGFMSKQEWYEPEPQNIRTEALLKLHCAEVEVAAVSRLCLNSPLDVRQKMMDSSA